MTVDPGKTRILVVDDDPAIREVVVDLLSPEGYQTEVAVDAESGLERFLAGDFELVVTDLKMPGHDGIWLIEQVLDARPDTAVVAISGFAETEMAVETLRRGAYDFISKPFRASELYQAVERALRRRGHLLDDRRYKAGLEKEVQVKSEQLAAALDELNQAYQATLESLAAALDAREKDTGRHSQRVMRYTAAIAAKMGIRGQLLIDIARGALLHDIGKIGVSDNILLKPGKLTPEEWEEMREHPRIGYEMVKDIPYLEPAAEIILAHQEKFDGTGYPAGLKGCAIPLGARIFSVADAYDAIVSDRPYRKGQSHEAAAQEIARCAGTQFDPAVVEVFLAMDPEELQRLRDADGLVGFEAEVAREEDRKGGARLTDPELRVASST
ncbi:MAG: response regulator [Deltaproteobacteria bacterium]|nr:MAG: response regulator [Deltaproteobacteria bacterium]